MVSQVETTVVPFVSVNGVYLVNNDECLSCLPEGAAEDFYERMIVSPGSKCRRQFQIKVFLKAMG